ncbi:hypothetical protein DIPPA_10071 [Diplonema papillatum]|nr:hypothetical protein DIPPA_10071 [Diplonema papillatum]
MVLCSHGALADLCGYCSASGSSGRSASGTSSGASNMYARKIRTERIDHHGEAPFEQTVPAAKRRLLTGHGSRDGINPNEPSDVELQTDVQPVTLFIKEAIAADQRKSGNEARPYNAKANPFRLVEAPVTRPGDTAFSEDWRNILLPPLSDEAFPQKRSQVRRKTKRLLPIAPAPTPERSPTPAVGEAAVQTSIVPRPLTPTAEPSPHPDAYRAYERRVQCYLTAAELQKLKAQHRDDIEAAARLVEGSTRRAEAAASRVDALVDVALHLVSKANDSAAGLPPPSVIASDMSTEKEPFDRPSLLSVEDLDASEKESHDRGPVPPSDTSTEKEAYDRGVAFEELTSLLDSRWISPKRGRKVKPPRYWAAFVQEWRRGSGSVSSE